MGEVISLGLKTTKIKDYKGAIKIISNHNMDKIINYSQSNSLAVIDIDVDYKHNPDDVEKVLKDLQLHTNLLFKQHPVGGLYYFFPGLQRHFSGFGDMRYENRL